MSIVKTDQPWWKLFCIQIGGALCLPIIIVGQSLSQTYGLKTALLAILIGNLFLMGYACAVSWMATDKRKTTIENASDYFGKRGIKLFSAVFIASMVGWFAIQTNLISEALIHLFGGGINPILANIASGIAVTGVVYAGIRGIGWLSQLSAPLLLLTLSYALYGLEGTGMSPAAANTFSLGALSLVIAATITCVIDLPTYWRQARSRKGGIFAAILLFGLGLPLIEGVGVYLGMHASSGNVIDTLGKAGGELWQIWVAGFVILAGWMSNTMNLYSASVNSSILIPKLDVKKRVLLFGGLGTIIACFNPLSHFGLALEIMGVLVASMGAVMISAYFIEKLTGRKEEKTNYVGWIAGSILGLASLKGFSLTSAPVLDAFLIGSLTTIVLQLISRREIHENVKN